MLEILPIHNPIKELVASGIGPVLLWGYFRNESGDFTIHTYQPDDCHDDAVDIGRIIAVVGDEESAIQLCRTHNATVAAKQAEVVSTRVEPLSSFERILYLSKGSCDMPSNVKLELIRRHCVASIEHIETHSTRS